LLSYWRKSILLIKFFPFENQKVFTRLDDPALYGDSASSVDIVSGDHANSDAGFSAFFDGFGDFGTDGVLDAADGDADQFRGDFFFVFPIDVFFRSDGGLKKIAFLAKILAKIVFLV
jgi:hypothetical protein